MKTIFKPELFKTSPTDRHLELMFEGPIEGGRILPQVKKHRALENDVRVVGYPGKPGCFSVKKMSEKNKVEVALFKCRPKEISREHVEGAVVVTVPIIPGWGFGVIGMLKKHLSEK